MFSKKYMRSKVYQFGQTLIACGALLFLWQCSDQKGVDSNNNTAIEKNKPEAESDPALREYSDIYPDRFKVIPKYDYIRSYPGGGGIFILKLASHSMFNDKVYLRLNADPELNATLTHNYLSTNIPLTEIIVRPSENVPINSTYNIEVYASRITTSNAISIRDCQKVVLEVEIFNWFGNDTEWAEAKRDEFLAWLAVEHPEYGDFSNLEWYAYFTYPQIWIVEHWTFMYEEWEMRVCFHVMIPPHDWSKFWLRERNEWDADITLVREHNGSDYEIHEIPIDDYPTFDGY